MVYSRLVNGYGPYLYRSVREGKHVHSIYMGKGSVSSGDSSVSLPSEAPQGDKAISNPNPIGRQGENKMETQNRMNELQTEITHLQKERERFTGAEQSGIRLGISGDIWRLRDELQKICPHEEQTKRTDVVEFNQAGRKSVYDIETCPTCKLTKKTLTFAEPLPEEAMWR